MAQVLTLTTPQSVTDYRISIIKFNWDEAKITVVLKDTQGDTVTVGYTGETATSLMVALNKANLSTNSLQKRTLEQLVTDGKIPAGTVSGSPD